jgi:hypothetical protein
MGRLKEGTQTFIEMVKIFKPIQRTLTFESYYVIM